MNKLQTLAQRSATCSWLFRCSEHVIFVVYIIALSFWPWTRVSLYCLLEDHRIKRTSSASESSVQGRTTRQIGSTSKWDNTHLQHCHQKPCGSGFTAGRRYLEVRAVGEKDVPRRCVSSLKIKQDRLLSSIMPLFWTLCKMEIRLELLFKDYGGIWLVSVWLISD